MSKKWGRIATPASVTLLTGFGGGVTLWLHGQDWSWLAAYLIAINVSTAFAYTYDKLAAKVAGPRIPEKVLILSAVVGGTPAAVLAQKLLRHKTSKTMFQLVFWFLATAQLVLAVWLIANHYAKR